MWASIKLSSEGPLYFASGDASPDMLQEADILGSFHQLVSSLSLLVAPEMILDDEC